MGRLFMRYPSMDHKIPLEAHVTLITIKAATLFLLQH